MSLKTFLSRLWNGVKRFFNHLSAEEKKYINAIVETLENAKKFADSDEADILTAIIPGHLDDDLKAKLRAWIPKLLIDLKLADECLQSGDENTIIKCALQKLVDNTKPEARKINIHGISAVLLEVLSDGKITWSDGVAVLQYVYKHIYQKAEEPEAPETEVPAAA